jgi:DNA-binding XRE family transcriptional regulator
MSEEHAKALRSARESLGMTRAEMAKFAGVHQNTIYAWEEIISYGRSMGISKKRALELVHKITPVDPFVAKELAASLGCLLPEDPKPGMCSGHISKSWPRRLCSKRATVTVNGCGFCKQHSPSEAEQKCIQVEAPAPKILRIQVDLMIEAERPFTLPEINPSALTTVCAIVAAQHIRNSGDIRMLPGGEIQLDMLEKPPKKRVRPLWPVR